MSFPKIIQEDIVNKGVTGLPDTPNLTTAEMQKKFDELSLDVLIPKYNALVDALMATTASEYIGVVAPEGRTGENLQALLVGLNNVLTACENAKHEHENKDSLDSLTETICASINDIVSMMDSITSVTNKVTGASSEIPTGKAIADYVQVMGGGDMAKAIYDANNDGVVNKADVSSDSEKLGGEEPSYYQPVTDETLATVEKTVTGAINELKVLIENAEVDTYTTMEQVTASTDPTVPVGAGAVKELNESLANGSVKFKVENGELYYSINVQGVFAMAWTEWKKFSSREDFYAEGTSTEASVSISGLGFQPDIVILWQNNPGLYLEAFDFTVNNAYWLKNGASGGCSTNINSVTIRRTEDGFYNTVDVFSASTTNPLHWRAIKVTE